MTRRELINKTLIYFLIFLGLFLLDSLIFSRIFLFGHRLNLIPFAVIALAVLENAHFGTFFGLAAGLILDISNGSIFFWYAITLMLLAFVCGRLLTAFMRKNILSAALCALGGSLFMETIHTLIFLVMYGRASFGDIFTQTLPAVLLSCIISLPVIWLIDVSHAKITQSCGL